MRGAQQRLRYIYTTHEKMAHCLGNVLLRQNLKLVKKKMNEVKKNIFIFDLLMVKVLEKGGAEGRAQGNSRGMQLFYCACLIILL